ncbi:putative inhibitor of apoptosis isoform X1 [Parasteatoda tepidariorum]|uniref:putative inhibitor of apoptosis isoform X1 n=2 Tax=Parasteatoda tepidariorum TaxID=114398 RepID=UPI00077FAF91|nr:putative inhibitor of apoptosis isoform X2 [Parasteatoda tepidariorum]
MLRSKVIMPNNNVSGSVRFANSNFQVVQNSGSTLPVDYSYEEERIKSFVPWPVHYPVDPLRLSKAGFYYAGNEDEVICFSCHGHIKDWNYGDIVQKKHSTLFPNCDFVNGRSRNVPIVNKKNQKQGSPDSKQKAPTSESTKYLAEIMKNINYNKMKTLDDRLKSFEKQWPLNNIDISKLAAAGFFYLGVEDKVQCPFCKGIVSNWESKDDPFEEHKKHFPWCDYLSDENHTIEKLPWFHSKSEDLCGNMQKHVLEQASVKSKLLDQDQEHLNLEQLGIHLYSSPAHPQQASLSARLRSFTAWPKTAPVSKEDLANAGFFYIGIGDHTKCFHCNGGLCNWEVGDDPWVEHAKWFCNCHFLRLNKGDEFVEEVLKTNVPENMLEKKAEDVSKFFCSDTLLAKVDEAMASSAVKYVLDSGLFPHYIVRVAVLRQIEETGSSFSDLNDLCSAVSCLKDEMEKLPVDREKSAESLNLNELDIRKCTISEMNQEQSSAAEGHSQGSLQGIHESADCSTKLVPQKCADKSETSGDHCLCKICMDKEVGVVFLPCGHLLACTECAGAMELCPMCRKPIQATIRAYLP